MRKVMVLIGMLVIVSFAGCEDSGPVCPDGMVPCDVNGDTICVPERIGC